MSHVDEGRLEAWIDQDRSGMSAGEAGAIARHLESCAACSSLLAEAMRLRERAGSILGGMQLEDLRIPDFERVQARASGVSLDAQVPPRQIRHHLVPLAWAASLIVAIGIGWMTRDLLPPGQVALQEGAGNEDVGSREAISAAPPAIASVPLPTGNEANGRGTEALGGASGTAAQAPPAAEVARAEAGVAGEGAVVASVAAADAGASAADAGDGPAGVVAQGRVVTLSGAPLPGVSVYVDPGLGTLTDSDGRFSLLVPEGRLAAGAELPLTVSGLGYASQTLSVADTGRDTITAHIELAPALLALESVVAVGYGEGRTVAFPSTQPLNALVTSAGGGASEAADAARSAPPPALPPSASGVPLTMSEAARQLGSPLVSVPGLEILSVERVGDAGAPVMQLRQRLPEGGTLLLIERVEPSLATILEDAPGVSTAQVRRGSLYVTGVAPISSEALQRLLDAAR